MSTFDQFIDRLLALSQEALDAGLYEVAYHALTAVLHAAAALHDEQRCLLVQQRASAHLATIDAQAPDHRLTSQTATERRRVNFYAALATQAAAYAQRAAQRRDQANGHAPPDEV